jgi:hypothetical protein
LPSQTITSKHLRYQLLPQQRKKRHNEWHCILIWLSIVSRGSKCSTQTEHLRTREMSFWVTFRGGKLCSSSLNIQDEVDLRKAGDDCGKNLLTRARSGLGIRDAVHQDIAGCCIFVTFYDFE